MISLSQTPIYPWIFGFFRVCLKSPAIAELPGVSESGEQVSCVLPMLYDDGVISNEYADTHLLFMMGSGPKMGVKASQIFDRVNAEVRQAAVDKGDTMVEIPDPLNDPAWKAPLEAGMQKYLSSVNGVDAQEVYEKAKAAGAACKV